MREKRQYARASVSFEVAIEVDTGTALVAEAADMSIGGMFVRCDEPPPIGVKVNVTCREPSLADTRIPGIVRWVKPGGFGVQFGLLGARETRAIGQIVRKAQQSEAD